MRPRNRGAITRVNVAYQRRTVARLPNASRIVLASRICCSTHVSTLLVTEHRYCRMNFVVSVLPAPLSPDITQDWLPSVSCRDQYAASAKANTCGSRAPIFCPWYRFTYSCKTRKGSPFVKRVPAVNEVPTFAVPNVIMDVPSKSLVQIANGILVVCEK